MAFKVSTAVRDGLLDTGSLKSMLDTGFIHIYSGLPPATANDAIGSAGTNVLLCTISANGGGGGINFDTAATSGAIAKEVGVSWNGTNLATGVAAWYRHVGPADTGVSSSTEPRLQGGIAQAGAELNLSSTSLTLGAQQTIDHYVVTLPTL